VSERPHHGSAAAAAIRLFLTDAAAIVATLSRQLLPDS
jgi:hypothetical protein